MRRYDDAVEVRKGVVAGATGLVEAPEQFLWRGGLWKVVDVLAHWVETGPWWQSTGVRTAIGSEDGAADTGLPEGPPPQRPLLGDLLTERELWRVEAGRGRPRPAPPGGEEHEAETGVVTGVFDLSFDWAEGRWTLVGCSD